MSHIMRDGTIYNPTFNETVAALEVVGFVKTNDPKKLEHPNWFEDHWMKQFNSNLEVEIYLSAAGYYCVRTGQMGDYCAPCHNDEEGKDLLDFFDKHYIR